MKFYQDLEQIGENEAARMQFVLAAVDEHKASRDFHRAMEAELYYYGENPVINALEKMITDASGVLRKNVLAANHKLASRFFGFVVDQAASYLLGNGVTFTKSDTKDKLGADFDQVMLEAMAQSQIGGQSFNFFNADHVENFPVTEFAPLYDRESGNLRAGIRFWQVGDHGDKLPERFTLYEEDGYTEYSRPYNEQIKPLGEKTKYVTRINTYTTGEVEIAGTRNYLALPIVPLHNNKKNKSELIGKKNTIDALDLASSNMVNGVSESNVIYWVLKNCGGMDAADKAQFLYDVINTRVVTPDGGADATAEPHTLEAPFTGTQATIDMVEKKLYTDFQAFDASAVTAGAQTATEIKARYVPLDLKVDKMEAFVTRCIMGLLAVAGIDDKPSYTRNKIVNTGEELQNVAMMGAYLPREYIVKKSLTLLGDADQFEEVMKQLDEAEYQRVATAETDQQEPDGEA